MALIVDTSKLTPANIKLFSRGQQLWLYCGLDGCVTAEIKEEVAELETPNSQWIYAFDMAVRVPAMAMSLTGLRVDMLERHRLLHSTTPGAPLSDQGLFAQRDTLWRRLQMLADAVWDRGLNPSSPAELCTFFYDIMRLERQYEKRNTGEKTPSCNRTALERLAKDYFYARPIIKHIFAIKDIDAQVRVLSSGVDSDSRIRASFNAKVTETGRWSSSKNCFGTGTNLQNISPRMRRVFIADEGCLLASLDLSQAESRFVAYRSGDEGYIAAVESGDVHTYAAMLTWPELEWDRTGSPEAARHNRTIADMPFYRWFSRRDMTKRGGHASNYKGSPFQVARHLKVEKRVIEEFQERYFAACPGLLRWHDWVAFMLQTQGFLTTPFGRRRTFFGRLNDKETIKEAIAYEPQSTIVDLLDVGLLRIWHHMRGQLQFLQQGHDSLLLGLPLEDAERLLPEIRRHLMVPLPITDISGKERTMTIPSDMKVGPNWGDLHKPGSKGFYDAMEKHNARMLQLAAAPLQTLLALPVGS